MKTFASALLAATFAAAVAVAPATACPYSNKEASLTDKDSYKTAKKEDKKENEQSKAQ